MHAWQMVRALSSEAVITDQIITCLFLFIAPVASFHYIYIHTPSPSSYIPASLSHSLPLGFPLHSFWHFAPSSSTTYFLIIMPPPLLSTFSVSQVSSFSILHSKHNTSFILTYTHILCGPFVALTTHPGLCFSCNSLVLFNLFHSLSWKRDCELHPSQLPLVLLTLNQDSYLLLELMTLGGLAFFTWHYDCPSFSECIQHTCIFYHMFCLYYVLSFFSILIKNITQI